MPPTDPRFLDATWDDIIGDLAALHAKENPDETVFEDDSFDMAREIADANAEDDDLNDPSNYVEI